jgi:hypothetical protein
MPEFMTSCHERQESPPQRFLAFLSLQISSMLIYLKKFEWKQRKFQG